MGYTLALGSPTNCSVSTVTLLEADQSLMASLGPKVIVVSSLWITLYSRYVRGSEQLVKSSS